MNTTAYWRQMGSGGTRIAPAEKRQPVTAEQIAQAEAELAVIAERIRNRDGEVTA